MTMHEQNYMSKYRMFTEESREEILRSITNHSSSKQAWSFSRQNRFKINHAQCPFISYEKNVSTITNRKSAFGTSRRKVFTESSQVPSPWIYSPSVTMRNHTNSFGPGRKEVITNSYLERDPLKNPGPGNYQPQSRSGPKVAYSLRPKTANHRNYFIDDKEQAVVPGPGNYESEGSKMVGKNLNSKYKTAPGGAALMNKSSRFATLNTTNPSMWEYKNSHHINLMGRSKGGKIGRQTRKSFIDKATESSYAPGPGKYKEPTEFGHYSKIKQTI